MCDFFALDGERYMGSFYGPFLDYCQWFLLSKHHVRWHENKAVELAGQGHVC
jgi:hypothetical protein